MRASSPLADARGYQNENIEHLRSVAPRVSKGIFIRHFWLAIVLAGLIPLAGRALLVPVLGIPKPAIQDEFGYLLAADTFASGRLTNATPRMADHFETLQQIVRPTYASKYPPFSSLVMAFAQKLFGEPWIGVWLSCGVLCSVLCWALLGWLPPVWAIAGTLVALARIGIVSYWTETYWGGSCAAIGGALLIGAIPRLLRRPRVAPALALAAGLAILANTRPYEGLLLTVPCLGYLAWRLGRLIPRVVFPMALVLVPVFGCMGYYNYRVTGHVLEMPYVEHDKQYNVWSPWLWNNTTRPAPAYSNDVLKDFWLTAYGQENQFARDYWLKAHVSDLLGLARFFLGWPMVLCILVSARSLWRSSRGRLALGLSAIFYAGCAMDARLFPHYAAPASALIYVLAGMALRAAWREWPGPTGQRRLLAGGVIALFLVTTGVGLLTVKNRFYFSDTDYHVKAKRETVAARLRGEPGEHLVLVKYGPRHDRWEELVYNGANIDESRIVWARSLGAQKDSELLRYYAKRTLWLLQEDGEVELERYSPSTQSTTPTQLRWVAR